MKSQASHSKPNRSEATELEAGLLVILVPSQGGLSA